VSKSRLGIPPPEPPLGIDLAAEARKARHRLYPVTLLYSAYALGLLAAALASGRRTAALWFAAGVAVWTLVEYLVHRYVLHGVFPDGRGALRRFLHDRFDDLHWRHHLQPWNGAHINGTIRDTGPFAAVLVAASFLAPWATLPVFVAAVLQSYVVEEWVHQSVHFYGFHGRYFRYIKRHHFFHHHGPRGAGVAFGLSSGMWDSAFGTAPPRRGAHDAGGAGNHTAPP